MNTPSDNELLFLELRAEVEVAVRESMRAHPRPPCTVVFQAAHESCRPEYERARFFQARELRPGLLLLETSVPEVDPADRTIPGDLVVFTIGAADEIRGYTTRVEAAAAS